LTTYIKNMLLIIFTTVIISVLFIIVYNADNNSAPSKMVFPRSFKIQQEQDINRLFIELGIVYTDKILFAKNTEQLQQLGKVYDLWTYSTFPRYYDHLSVKFYKYVDEKYKCKLFIKWVNDRVGYGLFTAQDINMGDYVIEYTGKISQSVKNTTWAWHYPIKIEGYNERISLDASKEGNEARFANHSLTPNLKAELIYASDGIWHLVYIALNYIKKDDQLLINYGSGYWKAKDSLVLK
jgi:hypothetical protein